MSGKNKAVVRRMIEDLFNSGDLDLADEVFAEDYWDHTPSSHALGGLGNVKRWIGLWRESFPDTRNTVENLLAEGDEVAVRWVTRATHQGEFLGVPPTGRQVAVTGYAIFRVEGGKVVEGWDTYEVWDLLHQLRTGSPDDILDFWFGREDEPGYGEFRHAWFQKDEDFDRQVQTRFREVYERAANGELDGWRKEARSALALVILLDQFPRNMFRGDARTHATDAKALETAEYAVARALDRELPAFQRMFLYMPYMHSESVEIQRRSVDLFERLAGEEGAPDVTGYAVAHRDIVERFGRFPHRNAILGRETSPEEAEFLTRSGSSF